MIKINNGHKRKPRRKGNKTIVTLFYILILAIIGYLAFQIGIFLSNWSEQNENNNSTPASLSETTTSETENASPAQPVTENNQDDANDEQPQVNASDLLNNTTTDEHNYTLTGYIDSLKYDSVDVDEIEILSPNDTNRISELNLDVNEDFKSGFYIYNSVEKSIPLKLDNNPSVRLIDFNNPTIMLADSTLEKLGEIISFGKIPFQFEVKNNLIVKITQIYIP